MCAKNTDNNFKTIKVEHFKNMVAIAVSDGQVEPDELEILGERAMEYGMSQNEVDEILTNAENLIFQVPLNNIDREEQLSDIVLMSMIDGEVNEKEYNLCLSIAERLDLKKKDLDKVIDLTRKLWENAK